MRASFAQLRAALPQAQWRNAPPDDDAGLDDIVNVVTDSRAAAAGSLFVALRGERFDAHDFVLAVQAQGAAAVVIEREVPGLTIPALIVADARVALGQLALYWRNQFALPVIGVTGSNGKTTVKEMIAAILPVAFGADGYLATRGNFNNDIGVPLTLFRLDAGQRAAVVELGMNHPGEIAQLAAIARPTVALVNNAQREHQEFMASVAAVADENGAVISALDDDGVAVFPADDEFTPRWRELAGQRRVLTFGLGADADVRATYIAQEFGSILQVDVPGRAAPFALHLAAAGEHNVRNALAAIACAIGAGIKVKAIIAGLSAFAPVAGRLQKKRAANGALLIDDTYNANPDSVRAAIDVLAQTPTEGQRVLILGDMGEVGDEGPRFHAEIGAYARAQGISSLLALGELMRDAVTAFDAAGSDAGGAASARATQFETPGELASAAVALVAPGDAVLVKGSRFMKMERVVQQLAGVNTTASSPHEVH